MKRLLLCLLLPAMAHAQCVVTEQTVVSSTVRVQERDRIQRDIVTMADGYRRCQVTVRARVGSGWYRGIGMYDWPGDRPESEACAVALARADENAVSQASVASARSDKVLICNDRPDNVLQEAQIGTQADLSQFRPHPDYPNRFWHNGAQCRFFLESNWTGRDVRTAPGVICQLSNQKWVVVDKF